ncbi:MULTISPECIES: hypothetical protein [Burkholderia]|uniref:hypothetical protein n=1 Tax=Burkholderia TaxID=32008 RepID=UPI0015C67811|nr:MULTISPECIES: hypothetical protein [Burkholderia]EKS9795448.1 hypothetical protein [Burkholderia cepacia]EKS9801975.1 hypothetical protein [Burkholderia cepacia]EKS9812079.1 hypothetical protein [Burkholderia cepacia]EKS9816960.1 hypothetical protein [Burkholderia cepacia]EKS9825760.1 hypothetical protein [Burkholderia cepacia]
MATGIFGEETFAFDPASNLLDDAQTQHFEPDAARGMPRYPSRKVPSFVSWYAERED